MSLEADTPYFKYTSRISLLESPIFCVSKASDSFSIKDGVGIRPVAEVFIGKVWIDHNLYSWLEIP
jgi:predicted SPOUT superfamily RNA methylase MTH1